MVCYLSQFLQQYSYYQFYNFKHLEQMINLTHQSLQIKLIPHKNKLMSSPLFNRKVPILLLTRVLPQRNSVIEWIYHAQKFLAFSKSTLFLAIATLDKLLISGMQLTETSNQLIAGSLTLLVTKFNEVYPVTIKKLQKLANNYFSLEKYIETQSMFLEILDFNLTPEDPIYQNLAELEYKLGESSEEIIKKAVSNPAVAFKLGGTVLISAIESINNGGLMELKNGSRLARESVQLRNQLQRLSSHSPGIKIIVSPQRA